MGFVSTLRPATGVSRVLDIGAGFGDSRLWLADSGRP